MTQLTFFFFLAPCPRWWWKSVCPSKILPQLLTTIEISTAVGNTIFLQQQRKLWKLWGCNIKHRLCIIIINRLLFGNSTSFLRKENSITAHPCKWHFLAALAIILYLLIFFWPQDNRKPLWTCFSKGRCMCPAGTFGEQIEGEPNQLYVWYPVYHLSPTFKSKTAKFNSLFSLTE